MKIYLTSGSRVRDVKAAFNRVFPYLKLEFFYNKLSSAKAPPISQKVRSNASLIEVSGVMKDHEIELTSSQKVSELEQVLQNKFCLPVQVFRRLNNSWLETTLTNNYTLSRQNTIGRKACNAIYDREILL